ncbi:ATP-binding protein [Owenweeksia hongkongensis]|uniref:tetratricopeptide repeat-containing sensor histidine kinase n=1 Tax=Owenweeksia hongkongensis TaxID=253245 RepID=UPI003A9154D0
MTSTLQIRHSILRKTVGITLFLFTASAIAESNNIETLLTKGDSILKTNPTEALNIYHEAENQLSASHNLQQQARVYYKLGTTSLQIGYYPKAITELKSALTLYQKLDEDSIVAELYSDLGSAYYFGEIKGGNEAEKYFQKAYAAFSKIGLPASAQFNANYLGYIHWAKGEKEKALEIHKLCLAVFDTLNNLKGRTICHSDIGFTLNSLGRYNEALEYNLKALELATQMQDPLIITPILNNIGISYLNLKDLKKAEKYSQLSLQKAEKISQNLRTKEALANLHDVYAQMENYKMAYETHLQLKAINDSIKDLAAIRKLAQSDEQAAFSLKQVQIKAQQAEKDALANAKLNHEKDRNIALMSGIGMLIVIALLLILNIRSRSRGSKLLKKKNNQLEDSNLLIAKQNQKLLEHHNELEEKNEELKTLLNELKQAQSKLIQYEKLASLGVLTSGVAHEINNPLNFLKSGIYALEELVENLPKDDNQELANTIIDHMNTGLKRITYITTELNRFSRNSAEKEFVACDVHKILNNCILILKPQLGSTSCTIQTNFANHSIIILGHESSLHQVFTNILDNSIRAISTSGTITISTQVLKSQQLEIRIEDTGCGMSEEVMHHAFDPFFTTRQAGEGIGLGLYVSYQLIVSHKGTINLESQQNVGTICIINLPINKSKK